MPGTDNGSAAGGEILKYIGNSQLTENRNMDVGLMIAYALVPVVLILIIIMILGIMGYCILKLFNVQSPSRNSGVVKSLRGFDAVAKRDAAIIANNRRMEKLKNMVEASPFRLSNSVKDYWSYNLTRANIRIPGGARIMKPEEFNAIMVLIKAVCCVIGVLLGLWNPALGLLVIVISLVLANQISIGIIRGIVEQKDNEILANFADMYLMLHYGLYSGAKTPIRSTLSSYAKTTSSEEMKRFIDTCCSYIDTHGEYVATGYITKEYAEITQVGKLMRLIRQLNDGGDVKPELLGFRQELLEAKRVAIEKRGNAIVAKAKASFKILGIILVQAVISSMAIYLEDIMNAGSFM